MSCDACKGHGKAAERSEKMDKGRLKLRLCLTAVVFLAAVIGVIYYFWYTGQPGTVVNEGTLIAVDAVKTWL